MAPTTNPAMRGRRSFSKCQMAKMIAPSASVMPKNCSTAEARSAVFARSTTLKPNASMVSIIRSMPKVMRLPGSTRVIQLKKS